MTDRLVTVTGGSGYVGQILRRGLSDRGYRVAVFDRVKGRRVDLLRRRHLGASSSPVSQFGARRIHGIQRRLEPRLIQRGVISPTWDDILDVRSRLADAFKGSHAVIHLAGIPHPYAPGTVEDDFRRINYDGSINAYEAAVSAGVSKFIFASSAQVYGINAPPRIEQFPILETNYCPGRDEGQTAYGELKLEVERFLARAPVDQTARTQAISLRLEYPGFQSRTPDNQYISTSVDNLVAGSVCAIECPPDFAAETFNLCDSNVDPGVVDIQQFLRERWPEVPNHTVGNECLLSTEKARTLLGYRPTAGGTYFDLSLIW